MQDSFATEKIQIVWRNSLSIRLALFPQGQKISWRNSNLGFLQRYVDSSIFIKYFQRKRPAWLKPRVIVFYKLLRIVSKPWVISLN